MSIKKSIAWIMGIVLLLTVISGAFLYMHGDQSGGVSSTNDPKYDYVMDKSVTYRKDITAGARNGSIKRIGAVSYQYSEVILTATLDQDIGETPVELVKPNSDDPYIFDVVVPCQIIITGSLVQELEVYYCYEPDVGYPDDQEPTVVRHYLGTGPEITVKHYPDGYAGEEGWIEVRCMSTSVTPHLSRMVVQMVPYTLASGVTQVIATSKNLIDYRGAMLRDGTPLQSVDNGVVMPSGSKYYIVIPVDLPAGTYTVTYSGSNEAGDKVGKYIFEYADGTYTTNSRNPGYSQYHSKDIKALWIYKDVANDELNADLIISDIQVESGSVATEYTPWFADKVVLTVPAAVTNLPGYGLGTVYYSNYIDLESGTYVQECYLDGIHVVPLDEPKVMDISHYLPPGSDNIDLYGVGSLIFINPYDTDVPSEVSYRRIIN